MIGSVLAKVICYLVTHFKAFIGVMSMLLLITILLLTCYFLSLQRKDNIWRWWNSCVINVSRCSHYGIPTGFLCCFITFSRSLFFYFSIFLIIFKHLINLLEGMQHFNITSYSFISSGLATSCLLILKFVNIVLLSFILVSRVISVWCFMSVFSLLLFPSIFSVIALHS